MEEDFFRESLQLFLGTKNQNNILKIKYFPIFLQYRKKLIVFLRCMS